MFNIVRKNIKSRGVLEPFLGRNVRERKQYRGWNKTPKERGIGTCERKNKEQRIQSIKLKNLALIAQISQKRK